jgi:hypothetical protein
VGIGESLHALLNLRDRLRVLQVDPLQAERTVEEVNVRIGEAGKN